MSRVTPEATNQPGPPEAVALWQGDVALRAALEAAAGEAGAAAAFAMALQADEIREAARAAERQPPVLQRFDRTGRRIDRIDFHPGYHALLALGLGHGYAALPWDGGRHATHAAMVYLQSQVEPATACPMTMTYAGYPVLAAAGNAFWSKRLRARGYDRSERPAGCKSALTLGMAMTEKQGGSDLRCTTTRAEVDGEAWRLTGHKWFCSAPMSDGFLTLAQTGAGLSCFLVPRLLPDGGLNAVHLMRLKDKLGNRPNASAEIEYHGAWGELVGEQGAGIRTILTMVHHTRLDTALAPAGLMRAALREAYHWCRHRLAFGARLIDQPLMARVLADLTLDFEGALALGFRVARAFDGNSEADRALARVGVALAKFHSNKLAPRVIAEAMEVLGGMGYVEDTALPMLYREAPLNGIWEGSGNVICLDILRSLATVSGLREVLAAELAAARGASKSYDAALKAHAARWKAMPDPAEARAYAEDTGLLLAAAALHQTAPAELAEAFSASRLGESRRIVPGALERLDPAPVLRRLAPELE